MCTPTATGFTVAALGTKVARWPNDEPVARVPFPLDVWVVLKFSSTSPKTGKRARVGKSRDDEDIGRRFCANVSNRSHRKRARTRKERTLW